MTETGVDGAMVSYAVGAVSGVGEDYTDSDGWGTCDIPRTALIGDLRRTVALWVNCQSVSVDDIYPKDGETYSFTLP